MPKNLQSIFKAGTEFYRIKLTKSRYNNIIVSCTQHHGLSCNASSIDWSVSSCDWKNVKAAAIEALKAFFDLFWACATYSCVALLSSSPAFQYMSYMYWVRHNAFSWWQPMTAPRSQMAIVANPFADPQPSKLRASLGPAASANSPGAVTNYQWLEKTQRSTMYDVKHNVLFTLSLFTLNDCLSLMMVSCYILVFCNIPSYWIAYYVMFSLFSRITCQYDINTFCRAIRKFVECLFCKLMFISRGFKTIWIQLRLTCNK